MHDKFKNLIETVHRHLEMPSTSWCIGSFGAIAEFHMDTDETVKRELSSSGGAIVSERGAIQIDLPEYVHPSPYEILRRGSFRWLHGMNFCVSESHGAMTGRVQLKEIGVDDSAIRKDDRETILFDIGLGTRHIDVCVRTGDEGLISMLRANMGRSVLSLDNPVMAAIKEQSPTRVFLSRLGRVEVYQEIGSSAKGPPTPHGPHTHVLPLLLKHRRTHAANIPVPDGWYPSLSMFPANPTSDDLGDLRQFNAADYNIFQGLMELFANRAIVDLKHRTAHAVRQGAAPFEEDLSRYQRTALRVALRQLHWTDGETETLEIWRNAFEPTSHDDEEDTAHVH